MAVPDWRTFPGGGTKRAALWLLAEVGEGGTFTKGQLRAAFPGEAQIDRRVRDLRDEGWVIHTNREDVSLYQEEQRLVTVGGRVWEKGYQSRKERTLTAKERQAIFSSDNYVCAFCGISGGEPYPDEPLIRAKLSVNRLEGPTGATCHSTVCSRCQQGRPEPPTLPQVQTGAAELATHQRSQLAEWVRKGRRGLSPEERVWADYRHLPSQSREEFRAWLLRSESES